MFTAMSLGALATVSLPAQNGAPRIIRIDNPKMTVFLPPTSAATGRAVVDLPGGGYSHLATGHEGFDWVPYFNSMGIAYAVVEYTLPAGNRELPYKDATDAIKKMREHASEWGIKTDDIGIMGSSAGGHLATTVATHADTTARPDFQILFYPVISMKDEITHGGSRKSLLGEKPSEADILEYSNELKVTADTPPAIILLSDDDKGVVPANSLRYYEALHQAGVPASMVIYPSGGHGWGYKPSFKYHDAMLNQLKEWLTGF
ncbi:alpha/beta hydrolase [Muribaculum intestinale]|uniref:alpha/beta hydrolase n=1 Tax=Muribaculum intestinale TaxID=1796646 RepID=UPI00242D4395|nr:alpha/beta hydrolase [Muribaculum intestinale]